MNKKLTLLVVALVLLSGCAFFQNQKANWDACKADVVCSEQAKTWQAKGETDLPHLVVPA